jgi:hypothetical protein
LGRGGGGDDTLTVTAAGRRRSGTFVMGQRGMDVSDDELVCAFVVFGVCFLLALVLSVAGAGEDNDGSEAVGDFTALARHRGLVIWVTLKRGS